MKKYMLGLIFLVSGCALTPTYVYDMSWSCNGNSRCASAMGAWSGNGQFSTESDCLAWETGFLNIYSGVSASACTQVQTN